MNTRAQICTLSSPAKLNLGLKIVGRRVDGYHLLESLFWPIDLVDTLRLTPSPTLAVRTEWEGSGPKCDSPLPQGKDNVVFTLLNRAYDPEPAPWDVTIRKRIPIGGGLGGGSSNAGTVLRWLRTQNLAGSIDPVALGADVAYFLNPTPAWVTGIGENIRSIALSDEVAASLAFLLIVPPFGCSTNAIFRTFADTRRNFSTSSQSPSSLDLRSITSFLAQAHNDLEPIATGLHPLLSEVIGRLKQTPSLYAALSGSGSTCFAVYSSAPARNQSAQELEPFCRKNNCRVLLAATRRAT